MTYVNFSKYHKDALAKTEVFVSLQFDVTRKAMYDPSRTKNAIAARYVAYFILSEVFKFPMQFISDIFKKDVSSVRGGLDRIRAWQWDEEIVRQFKAKYPSIDGLMQRVVDKPVDFPV